MCSFYSIFKFSAHSVLFAGALCYLQAGLNDIFSGSHPVLTGDNLKAIAFFEGKGIDFSKIGISCLGGGNNDTYKIETTIGSFVLRKTRNDSRRFSNNLKDEYENHRAVDFIGITSSPCFYDETSGVYISKFINGIPLETKNFEENLMKIAQAIASLHTSTVRFAHNYANLKLFTLLQEELFQKVGYRLSPSVKSIEGEVIALIDAIQKIETTPVPCHNDLNINNFIIESNPSKSVRLIDWEYSGLNSPAWDIAYFLLISDIPPHFWKSFIGEYLKNARCRDVERFLMELEIYKPLVLIYMGHLLTINSKKDNFNEKEALALAEKCFSWSIAFVKSASYLSAKSYFKIK